jgi:Protein of unknown function (DUF3631)
MTMPPPTVCRRIRKLHAMLGSSNTGEREAAYKKLVALLAEHSLTWNAVPEILAAADAAAASGAPQSPSSSQPSSNEPEVNVLALVLYFLERHIAILPAERTSIALWILHSWIFDRFAVTPRLALLSPVRGCGKTTLLVLIEALVANPWRTDDISPAAIYRQLEHQPHTCFLVDEADNADLLRSRTLRAVFNSGHRRGGGVGRFDRGWSRRFRTFAPLAIGAIGTLPLPLMHRSIVIAMQRAPADAGLETLNEDAPELVAAREQIGLWAAASLKPDPEMPAELHNRLADNWRPLFAVADDLGHGEGARSAALELSANRPDEDPGIILLTDIRTAFTRLNTDRVTSADLVGELLAINDFWLDWSDERAGRKLNQGDLARMLRAFRIRSSSIWPVQRTPSSKSRKGYLREQFEAAWATYCDGTTARRRRNISLVGG